MAAIIFASIANWRQPDWAFLWLPWSSPTPLTPPLQPPNTQSPSSPQSTRFWPRISTFTQPLSPSPTVHHHAVASELLRAGVDLLVEKPLAASLAEADDLLALAAKHERILQPGHLERFNPAVLTVEPRLRRPMFFESHRLSLFTPRALDVDVVLDLMIHDLDIVLTFAASPVSEVRAVGLPILSPKVDIANVRVEFESGCVANFTASRVSTETRPQAALL